jgi:hypothetical protein
VDADSPQFGEQVLIQMSNIPAVDTGTSWENAYDTARSAQYAVTELLGESIDPEDSNSVHVMPVPLVLTGKNKHGVDFHDSHERTTLAAEYGEITDSNILNPEEDGIGGNEGLIAATTRLDEIPDANFRWEHYDRHKESMEEYEITEPGVDLLHTEIGKLIPGLYPAGKVPSQPQAWISRSGMKLLQEGAVTSYDGPDIYFEMRNGFEENVEAGEMGHISSSNEENPLKGEITVTPVSEDKYTRNQAFAPERSELGI